MNALRETASLQSTTPERIRKSREMQQLQGVSAPSRSEQQQGALNASTSNSNDDDDDDVVDKVEEWSVSDILVDEPALICTPPAIRRRRKPSDERGGGDATDDSLSFIEETVSAKVHRNGDTTRMFPIALQRKGARLGTLKSTPTCRAMFVLIMAILVSCALLSHYTSTNTPSCENEGTAMTLSEQQVLLKAYIGDLEGGSSSNVKLPAGGNPIDLIHLLHSSTIEEEEEGTRMNMSNATPILTMGLTLTIVVVVVLCFIMAE